MQNVYVHETKKTYKMPPHTKHNGLEHFFLLLFFQLLKFNFFYFIIWYCVDWNMKLIVSFNLLLFFVIIRVKKKSQHRFETQFHITKFTFIVWKILKMRGPRLKQRKNKSPFVFFYIKKTIVSILVLFLSFFLSFLFFSFLFAFTHQILIFFNSSFNVVLIVINGW